MSTPTLIRHMTLAQIYELVDFALWQERFLQLPLSVQQHVLALVVPDKHFLMILEKAWYDRHPEDAPNY